MTTMNINFCPQRRDDTLTVSKLGDALIVNGETFDFTELPEGATLPADAIDSYFFAGPVERIEGVLHVTLLLPHGPNPPHEVAFPTPVTVTEDGPINLINAGV